MVSQRGQRRTPGAYSSSTRVRSCLASPSSRVSIATWASPAARTTSFAIAPIASPRSEAFDRLADEEETEVESFGQLVVEAEQLVLGGQPRATDDQHAVHHLG